VAGTHLEYSVYRPAMTLRSNEGKDKEDGTKVWNKACKSHKRCRETSGVP